MALQATVTVLCFQKYCSSTQINLEYLKLIYIHFLNHQYQLCFLLSSLKQGAHSHTHTHTHTFCLSVNKNLKLFALNVNIDIFDFVDRSYSSSVATGSE